MFSYLSNYLNKLNRLNVKVLFTLAEFERRNSAGKIPDAEDGADIENVEFVRRKPKGKRQSYD